MTPERRSYSYSSCSPPDAQKKATLLQLEKLIAAGLLSPAAYKRALSLSNHSDSSPFALSKKHHESRAAQSNPSATGSKPSAVRPRSVSAQRHPPDPRYWGFEELSDPATGPSLLSRRAGSAQRAHSASSIPRFDLSQSSRHNAGRAHSRPPGPSRNPSDRAAPVRPPAFARLRAERSSMHASRGVRDRHERTFVGTECAACEEPLEHTLRGERILQLTCGHVSHEACFYEYIKEFDADSCPVCECPLSLDTNRGANIDFENLQKLVRSAQTPDIKDGFRNDRPLSPPAWEAQNFRHPADPRYRPSREHLLPASTRSLNNGYHVPQQSPMHERNPSGEASKISSGEYQDTHHSHGRRHDYDVQSMETSLSSPKVTARNPIPCPTVTVRSEFPTLNRSRQQQSLTCIVTVEVIDGKWQPHADDLRSPPPVPPLPSVVYQNPVSPRVQPQPQPVLREKEVDAQRRSIYRPAVEDGGLEDVKNELRRRVDNWHGLDFDRFGRLALHGMVRVGKDRHVWQVLECYLFSEMLICVKEKRNMPNGAPGVGGTDDLVPRTRCTLKGSILIKKHLKEVETDSDSHTLTLSLSVAELPQFHLQFLERSQMETWQKALRDVITGELSPQSEEFDQDTSGTDEEEDHVGGARNPKRASSAHSSVHAGDRSQVTAPTEYTTSGAGRRDMRLNPSHVHVPVDLVVVVPVSSSMQGLKINILRDALRFMVSNLGEQDRMGLVTFGSGGGGVPLVGMTNKHWSGWSRVLDSIRPAGQKSMRADVVEGANVAMDLLMQRRSSNPLASILLISDSATTDSDSLDFVVSRAEAAKITIHSFGLGLTHRPDTLVEISTRTKASYTYVKDWMMLRECIAGALGSLQSVSHQNVKLKLRLPEGSPAKFVKISGALQTTKRAAGRDAEALLGDLRFGDKRDILVQLVIQPDGSSPDSHASDPWENVIAGLEALGGGSDNEDSSGCVEELPLIQADLAWGDLLRDGTMTQLPRPSLLAITMFPSPKKQRRPPTPPIPPHPSVVQRRMELLTSDMLSRALTLSAKGMHDRASHLLAETRSILKGLGKGGLPPLPTPPPTAALPAPPPPASLPPTPHGQEMRDSPIETAKQIPLPAQRTPSPTAREGPNPFAPAVGIDPATMVALDTELANGMEYIIHPTVFGRDSRKAMLQAIGIINSQRAYTSRSPVETLWAARVPGIRRLTDCSRDWRDSGEENTLQEEP